MTAGPEVITVRISSSEVHPCAQPGCRAPAVYMIISLHPSWTPACAEHNVHLVESQLDLAASVGSERMVTRAVLEASGPWSAKRVSEQLLAVIDPDDLWLVLEHLSVHPTEGPSSPMPPALDIRVAAAAVVIARSYPTDAAALRDELVRMSDPWLDEHAETDIVDDFRTLSEAAKIAADIVAKYEDFA